MLALFFQNPVGVLSNLAEGIAEFITEPATADTLIQKSHNESFVVPGDSVVYGWLGPGGKGAPSCAITRRWLSTRFLRKSVMMALVAVAASFLVWRCALALLSKNEVGERLRVLVTGYGGAPGACGDEGSDGENMDEDENESFLEGVQERAEEQKNSDDHTPLGPVPTPQDIYAELVQLAIACRESLAMLPQAPRGNFAIEALKFAAQEIMALSTVTSAEAEGDREKAIASFMLFAGSAGQRRISKANRSRLKALMRVFERLKEESLPDEELAKANQHWEAVLLPSAVAVKYYQHLVCSLASSVDEYGASLRHVSCAHRLGLLALRRARTRHIVGNPFVASLLLSVQQQVARSAIVSQTAVEAIQSRRRSTTAAGIVGNLNGTLRRAVPAGLRQYIANAPWALKGSSNAPESGHGQASGPGHLLPALRTPPLDAPGLAGDQSNLLPHPAPLQPMAFPKEPGFKGKPQPLLSTPPWSALPPLMPLRSSTPQPALLSAPLLQLSFPPLVPEPGNGQAPSQQMPPLQAAAPSLAPWDGLLVSILPSHASTPSHLPGANALLFESPG